MSRLLELASDRWAHASGALWLPQSRTAFVADAHLGYSWAQRRRGELGPLRDDGPGARLDELVDELQPLTIVFLGDIVHAPRPAPEEHALIATILGRVAARTSVVMVRGNHDRGFARDFGELGYPLFTEWRGEGIMAVHGDRLPPIKDEHLVIGHFHPVLSPRDAAGAKQRIPVFVWTERTTILPAFSQFAAGCDLVKNWTQEISTALGSGRVQVVASTGKRVAQLPFRRPARP